MFENYHNPCLYSHLDVPLRGEMTILVDHVGYRLPKLLLADELRVFVYSVVDEIRVLLYHS